MRTRSNESDPFNLYGRLDADDPPPTLASIIEKNPFKKKPLTPDLVAQINGLPFDSDNNLSGVEIRYCPLPEIEWKVTLSPEHPNFNIINNTLEQLGFKITHTPNNKSAIYQLRRFNLTPRSWSSISD